MRTFSIGRFSTITGMVLMATAVAAGSRASDGVGTGNARATPGEHEEHKAGRPGKDVYGVVNLGGGPFAFIGEINARGQAAFEYFGLDGQVHVGFFDGTRLIDVTPPDSQVALMGALNDKGEVAFAARVAEPGNPGPYPFRPFRWSAPRGLVPLPSLGSGETFVTAINNRSEIVGRSALSLEDGTYRAARWTAANRLVSLPSPAGISHAFAADINDNNVAVGYGNRASGAANVLTWDAAGRPTNLGPLGTSSGAASHVNKRGDIAGMIDMLTPDISAFLWSPGRGAVRIGARTITHELNELGEVVGRRVSGNPDPAPRAFLFSRARGLVDLHPRGLYVSEANDVNDRSVVVGLAQRTPGENIAYRWTRGGGPVDLNTRLLNPPSGLVLTSALAISNNGDILADSNAGVVLLRANGGGTDAPVLGPIRHAEPRLNQPLELSLSFRDRNLGDTHTATVDWGDGSGPQAVALRQYRGRGEVRASHTYTSNGDYNVIVRVTDSTGKATQLFQPVTVLDLGTPGVQSQGASARPAGASMRQQLQARALAQKLRHGPMQLFR